MRKILFGIFDWGLGHATRSSTIINKLLEEGNEIHIISTGRALKVLKDKYGDSCKYFDVPSLYPPYTKTRFFAISFTLSTPMMYHSLIKARRLSKKIISEGKYDLVISDCRYDVYDTPENSFLINHQLKFIAPPVADRILEYWLYSQSKHYKNVIVPDFEKDSLSGNLSHNLNYYDLDKVKYVGVLSHLSRKKAKKDIDYFITLTGPEPQRTILEEKVLSQVSDLKGKVVITGGNPDIPTAKSLGNVEFYGFANSTMQEDFMNRAKCVISRTGYTSMMEFYELGINKALLMPTPGQTEQEYLATYYLKNKIFYTKSQYELNLKEDLKKVSGFSGFKEQHQTKDSVRNVLDLIYR